MYIPPARRTGRRGTIWDEADQLPGPFELDKSG
jgi:hypothetical protein